MEPSSRSMALPSSSPFPTALTAYPPAALALWDTLADRLRVDPFNGIATGIFAMAILHTFMTARVTALSHRVQERRDERLRASGQPPRPSVLAGLLHFAGEVEIVFGLWAAVLLSVLVFTLGWRVAKEYVNNTVDYTEPLFVVVIMALASTRPILSLADAALSRVAGLGGGAPAAWWCALLTVGPLLGSFITEPAAMTICALLLARHFFERGPSPRLKYATLGLLFVNVSIGGMLTDFAAAPVLMVARPWGWTTSFMLRQFGWRVLVSLLLSTGAYLAIFRRELRDLASRPRAATMEPDAGGDAPSAPQLPVPWWVILVHVLFMAWTVLTSHEPALFVGGFLFFLGFAQATTAYQARIDLRAPLLVGFFLGGLVVHGGLQGWWIEPILSRLSAKPLFAGAMGLTAFNDNAMVAYLASLVPNLGDAMKIAVLGGAVVGGGLTVIANAPNPAGQALLSRFFEEGIGPLRLLSGAALPTALAAAIFLLT